VSGQIHVAVAGAEATLKASPADATEYSINYATGLITFGAAVGTTNAPVKAVVGFRYKPTVQEATLIQGSGPVGGFSGAQYLGVTGVITEGDVFTDHFDASDNWAAGGAVHLGAGGIFTLKTTGTELKGVNILEAPAAGSAFLGLNFGPYSG
jgi:hypothetical protein